MEIRPAVRKQSDGKYVPVLVVNGQSRPVGPECASARMAQMLANKRYAAIEAFTAVATKADAS